MPVKPESPRTTNMKEESQRTLSCWLCPCFLSLCFCTAAFGSAPVGAGLASSKLFSTSGSLAVLHDCYKALHVGVGSIWLVHRARLELNPSADLNLGFFVGLSTLMWRVKLAYWLWDILVFTLTLQRLSKRAILEPVSVTSWPELAIEKSTIWIEKTHRKERAGTRVLAFLVLGWGERCDSCGIFS